MKYLSTLFSRGRRHGVAARRPGAVPRKSVVEKNINQKNMMHNIFALGIFLLFVTGFWSVFNYMADMPTGEIFISGQTGLKVNTGQQGSSEKELLSLAKAEINEGFWQLNLVNIKRSLESHIWVRQAEVRRQWPNKLFIGIDEYVPVARWNDHYLLTTTGDMVMPQSILPFTHLPMLRDHKLSKTSQIKDMISWFNFFQQPLIHHGLNITEQSRSAQGEIVLVINDRLNLVLGADEIKVRFERLLSLLDTSFKNRLNRMINIDLRYSNGIAVKEDNHVVKQSMYIGQVKHQ